MRLTETRPRPNIAVLVAAGLLLFLTVFIVQNTVKEPMVIYAILYLFGFVALAWLYPQTALLITFAAGPFQADLSNGQGFFRFSIVEMNLALIGIVFALRSGKSRVNWNVAASTVIGVVYIAICVASSLGNWRSDCLVALLQTALYLVVTVLIYSSFVKSPEEFTRAFYALVIVCMFLTATEVGMGTAFVLGLHKNGIGSSLAFGLIVATELWIQSTTSRRRAQLGAAFIVILAGLVYSLSRGAWMGAFIGISAILLFRGRVKTMLQAVFVAIPAVILLWNYLPAEKKASAANFNSHVDNIRLRMATIDYTWRLFQSDPLVGAGVAVRKEIDATNVILVTLAETGVPGLCAFLLMHVQVFRMAWSVRRHVAPQDPRYSIMVLAVALTSAKLVHGTVDHYWGRGTLSVTWATVGVATGVYCTMRRQQRMRARQKFLRPRAVEDAS